MALIQDALKNIQTTAGKLFHTAAQELPHAIQNTLNTNPVTAGFSMIASHPQIQNTINNTAQRVSNAVGANPVVQQVAKMPLIQLPGINGMTAPFSPTIGDTVKGRIIKPAVDAYQGYVKAATPNTPIVDRGKGLFQGVTSAMNLTPMGSAPFIPYEAAKSGIQAFRQGKDINKAVSETIAGNRTTGLGDVFTDNNKIAGIGNLSELPLMIASGHIKGKVGEGMAASNVVVKKNYLEKVQDLKPKILDVALRFEKSLGSLSDPANPKMDASLYDDALAVWKHLHGANRNTPPPRDINQIIGEIKQTYQGAMTELRMMNEGAHISGNNIPKMGIVKPDIIPQELEQFASGIRSRRMTRDMFIESVDKALNNGNNKTQQANAKNFIGLLRKEGLSPDEFYAKSLDGWNLPELQKTIVKNISSEGSVVKGKLRVNNLPTQTEIQNRVALNQGKPDLYSQRETKWSEPMPWEGPNAQQKPGENASPQSPVQTPLGAPKEPRSSMPLDVLDNSLEGNMPGREGRSSLQKQLSEVKKNDSAQVDSITNKPGMESGDKTAFANWVNERRATETEKYLVKQDFKDLDSQGLKAFYDVQAGKTEGRLGEIRKFLNDKFDQARSQGIDFDYQKDYLPQLWNNSAEEIAQILGRRMSTKPGFTMEKLIKDYQTGIAAGLTPKFTKVSDLLGWYEGAVNKAVADRKFMNYLDSYKMIMPSREAPSDWVTISPDRFARMRSTNLKGNEVATEGSFKAPRELAEMINNYLFDPKTDGSTLTRGLEAFANYVSKVKNITLSFGVPGTAINAHGFNILARHTIFGQGGNMITRFAKAATYLVNQKASGDNLVKIAPRLPDAIKKGLTIGVEERKSIMEGSGLKSKFGEAWSQTFETALFDKMLPSLKYSSYEALFKDFSKSMPVEKAQREAAKIANNVYGGINWEQMGRDKNMQNLLRSFILAPDWAESTLRLGGNFAKALTSNSPVARKYQNMMAAMITAYIGANVANKLSSGKFMWDNESGHTMEIQAGYTSDGQKRYIRPFGTAVDMVRLPYDTVLSLAKGDLSSPARTIRNRLSIPAGVGIGALTDVDYRGNSIGYRGTDKYGNQMKPLDRAVNIGTQIGSLAGIPSFAQQILRTGSGQQGTEQGVMQSFELPVRYTGGQNSAIQKQVGPIAQKEGQSGKQLYDTYQSVKGETKFSDNQKAYIDESGTQGVNDLLQQREYNRIIKKMENGETLSPEENGLIQKAGAAEMTPQTTANTKVAESIAQAKVKATGNMQQVGNTIFYKDDNGSVTSVKLDRPIYQPKLTGIEDIDNIERDKELTSYSNKISDVYKLYKLGKLSAAVAGAEIGKLRHTHAALQTENAQRKKALKGTGTGRKRVGRAPAIKNIKSTTTKISMPKLPKIKLEGAKTRTVTPKRVRIKPLKISPPKKVKLKYRKGGI